MHHDIGLDGLEGAMKTAEKQLGQEEQVNDPATLDIAKQAEQADAAELSRDEDETKRLEESEKKA